MSFSLPVNIIVLLAFVIFVFYLLGIYNLLNSYRENECDMTFMFQYPQFVEISMPSEVQKAYPKYALYGYGEGGFTEQLREMKFKGIPVLFIPGSSGSYKQGRSLASVSLRKSLNSRTPFHFNYFMVDFNEEQVAVFGGVLEDQRKFVSHCIKKIFKLYQNNEDHKKPTSVILIGHSFGGLIIKGLFIDPDFDSRLVHLIITLSTPHKYPLIQPDHYITSYYKNIQRVWKNNSEFQHINLISIGGGLKDIVVHSYSTSDPNSDFNVLTTNVPGVWLNNDHLSIMWCKQLILTIIRAIFDSVDVSTKQLSTDKNYVKDVFRYHLLKRNAGKRYSGSLTSRFSSFERSSHWYENLQRQFTVTEANGLRSNHYIMIRLFSDPKSEAGFIEAYNVNVKDWIFVCSADVVYNSIRMCDSGENLSNMTEIAPVDSKLKLKRKFVSLNLHELKEKSFTHVLVRLPPSDSFMSVNVDVYQPSERNITFRVPKFYSFLPKTVIENTQDNAIFYSISLVDFDYIWQSYLLTVNSSCRTAKNHAVVSFISPWSHEDQHFVFSNENSFTVPLNLISPKPRNNFSSLHPTLRLNLHPTCKYEVKIQYSISGVFSQCARYYSFMLPAFLATVCILTVRQQMTCLDEGRCVLFQSALSSAVRRYYIILQASVFGSKILGFGLCLSVLPVPDFLVLQELNLDSFLLTILLYAVAVVVAYLFGTACYLAIVISGQAAHKLALRFVAKAISGVFNWSEWVIAALHQVPILVSVILISLSLSTSGAVGLWLGTIFYFLKLCKMYEEYVEEWFNYSIKLIATKVKDAVTGRREPQNVTEDKDKSKTPELTGTSQIEKFDSGVSQKPAEEKTEEIDFLSAIHFHISVFLIWLLVSSLYIPSLVMWAKNYNYNIYLEKDPAKIPSIIVSACGAVLWQPGVPKSCRKLSQVTTSTLFLMAVVSIIYASLSLYRLGYILSATLVVLSLNQFTSKYL